MSLSRVRNSLVDLLQDNQNVRQGLIKLSHGIGDLHGIKVVHEGDLLARHGSTQRRFPIFGEGGSRLAFLWTRFLRIGPARALIGYRAGGHRWRAEQAPQNGIELGLRDFGDIGHETIVRPSSSNRMVLVPGQGG